MIMCVLLRQTIDALTEVLFGCLLINTNITLLCVHTHLTTCIIPYEHRSNHIKCLSRFDKKSAFSIHRSDHTLVATAFQFQNAGNINVAQL